MSERDKQEEGLPTAGDAGQQRIPSWFLGMLIPGLVTACAYVYYVALGSSFGVPRAMISIQAGEVLVAFGALAVVFFYFNSLLSLGHLLLRAIPWWIREPYANLMPLLILGSLFALAVRQSGAWLLLFVVLFAFVPLTYGVPLLFQRKTKGYAAKLRADTERIRSNLSSDDLMGWSLLSVLDWKFPQYVRLLSICLVLLGLAYAAGWGAAASQKVFPVTATRPTRVVVAVIGDRAFLREMATDGGVGSLQVIAADSLPPLVQASLDSTQTAALRSRSWPIEW